MHYLRCKLVLLTLCAAISSIDAIAATEYVNFLPENNSTASVCESVATEQAWESIGQEIIHELVIRTDSSILYSYPSIEVLNSYAMTAFATDKNKVLISSGLLNELDSFSEFAFVIAHEISHLVLGHNHIHAKLSLQEQLEHEIEADELAFKLIEASHFKSSAGSKLLNRIAHKDLEKMGQIANIYPTLLKRVKALDKLASDQKLSNTPILSAS